MSDESVVAGRLEALRLFVALETNGAVQQAIAEAQRAMQRFGELPVRWTNPAQAHLTLVFLGNVMAADVSRLIVALWPIAMRHDRFDLRVNAIGAFPSTDNPRVLWLGVGGAVASLIALQRALASAIVATDGIDSDRKPFRPHLTLGRVNAGRKGVPDVASVAAALARPVTAPSASWPIASFALFRSVLGADGPRYTVLERFPLRMGEQTR